MLRIRFASKTGVVILRADVQPDRYSRTQYNPVQNFFEFGKK